MCKHILVPVDGTELAESALAPASSLARRCDADLLLVGATRGHAFPGLLTSAAKSQAGTLEYYLSVTATLLRAEGVQVDTAVLGQRPARSIALQCKGRGVDLIVVATNGRTGLEGIFHSSITWGVLRQSPVPVLALKHPPDEEGCPPGSGLPRFLTDPAAPIVVPLDGSLRAERALPFAQEFAWLYAHSLLLVRAIALPYFAGGVIDYPMTFTHLQEWSLEEARGYLKRKQEELARTGLEVKTASMFGGAAGCIETCVQDYQAGLVVMVSHGRCGLGRLLLGSVARRLLSRVAVPILLVPDAHAQTGEDSGTK